MKTRTIALLAAALTLACGRIEQKQEVSECGGFADASSQQQALEGDSEQDYPWCQPEELVWEYDAASSRLRLTNTQVYLNCCGEQSIEIEETGEGCLVSERDSPQGQLFAARCDCMCLYDFRVEAEEIEKRPVTIEIVREVTDSDRGVVPVWRGTIDLAQGSGRIVVKEGGCS
ncbi:MAG: hypothetical protein ACOX6T_17660 [Myxococcales bacterium]|jgi:hypothetical protein